MKEIYTFFISLCSFYFFQFCWKIRSAREKIIYSFEYVTGCDYEHKSKLSEYYKFKLENEKLFT